ncbi:MAG: alpha/beta fold hydrolase [Leptolyngbyaceae cyanobacterium CSU_1_4]|nr:alpha/beta fold hydrolase [Leptolyngbyaceae cyanobacterium CSU_1_4]
MTTQEHRLEVGALTWFYREALPINPSDKPPVVLLHGLLSQSYGWRHVLPALAEQGFRSIAPDWIGFGSSSKPDRRTFAYTPGAYITALEAFFKALNLDRFSLVVQGFMGSMGLQYALRHPEQIERLAIFNAPIAPEAKLPWKIKLFGLPLLGEVLRRLAGTAVDYRQIFCPFPKEFKECDATLTPLVLVRIQVPQPGVVA